MRIQKFFNPQSAIRNPQFKLFILLLLIVFLAGFLRFAGLDRCPPGLFRDEAEKGYNAWALATSGGVVEFAPEPGKGPPVQWRRLPWMVSVMGNKTSAIYHYASVPFMWAGGLRVSTARMASALIGTLTIALVGLLFMRAWGIWAGLAAALWLALSPWHLNFSRWALEGIFVPFFLALALAGLCVMERHRRWGWPLAGASLGWLFYSYSGAQPLVLAWGICLVIQYCGLRSRRPTGPSHLDCGLKFNPKSANRNPQSAIWFWLGLILFLIPVIPTLLVRLEPGGSIRLSAIAIWSAPGAGPLDIIGRFILNYLAHFDPRFLFLSGDAMPRHNAAGMGQLPLIDALLIPIGLVASLRGRRPLAWALVALFLCAPLPAAITRSGIPHALRAFGMALPAAIWGGLGLVELTRWVAGRLAARTIPRRRAIWMAGAIALACVLVATSGVARYRQACAAWRTNVAFETGLRQAWETLAQKKQPGQRAWINGYILYGQYYQLFFMQPPPRSVLARGLEAGGFYYFDPERTPAAEIERKMASGDWLLTAVDPAGVTVGPSGERLLTPAESRRIGEAWGWLTHKP